MNLQAIIVANVTGFLIILTLYFSRFVTRTKSDLEEHVFDVIMGLAMFGLVVEPITFAVDGIHSTVGYWVNLLGNTCLYYANGIGIFLWLMYVDMKLFHDCTRMKKIYYKLSIPVGILLLSLIANIKFKYYFYIDDNFVYHRQPTVIIFYIYVFICALYSIVLYFYAKHVKKIVAFFPIYLFLGPIVVGCIIQMMLYGVSLAWLGTAVGCVALYMGLQQQKAYIDSLTGLYNRQYLAHIMYKMSRNSANDYYGMMIDMNDFKSINDKYGHSAGDTALTDVAEILNTALDSDSTAFRYAGDEFIVITKKQNVREVENLEKKLHLAAEEFNASKKRPYTVSFSVGYSHYDFESDSSDRFLKKIDDAMYTEKKRYHSCEIHA
ncbi:MAG: GGDEF domain-containing protein [Lachnospiraceae bacterium]|nr:GGDEF domain-containing protein [Lachnospiraceae bacterium]